MWLCEDDKNYFLAPARPMVDLRYMYWAGRAAVKKDLRAKCKTRLIVSGREYGRRLEKFRGDKWLKGQGPTFPLQVYTLLAAWPLSAVPFLHMSVPGEVILD